MYKEEMIRHEMKRNVFLGHVTSVVVLRGLTIRVNARSEKLKGRLLL
jgi:hypothetical protein